MNQSMEERLDELKRLLGQVQDLKAAADVLEWDQETYMPNGAANARAHQVGTLRKLAHTYFTTDEIGVLLEALASEVQDLDPISTEASLIRVTRRDYERALKLPVALVAEIAEAVARGKQAWREARATNTYAVFAPHLERLIDLNIRKAEAVGYEDHIYDALLDEFEEGMKTATVAAVFADLRTQLVPIVQAIAEREPPESSFLHGTFDRQVQWDFGMAVLKDFGYDFNRGRQDISTHPFTTSFSITDVRLTTRIDEQFLPSGLSGTLHECGHGLYEQGIALDLDRTPLADGTSLGMHESQSRLWENLVGLSRPFWQHYYPRLQARFPEQLAGVSVDAFYRGVNKVAPSLIRVEADEVTYNLHIMLRFELEQAMVEGRVTTAELPALWNAKMEEYLGRAPRNRCRGGFAGHSLVARCFGLFPYICAGQPDVCPAF